jgi:hypothetical protein
MKHQPNSDPHNGHDHAQEADIPELVCSAEFAKGCTDPLSDIKPIVNPEREPVSTRPAQSKTQTADSQDREIVAVPDPEPSGDAQEAGYPESACSAEFPKGCVDPEGTHP